MLGKRLACGTIENNVSVPFISAFTNATRKLAETEKKKIHFFFHGSIN